MHQSGAMTCMLTHTLTYTYYPYYTLHVCLCQLFQLPDCHCETHVSFSLSLFSLFTCWRSVGSGTMNLYCMLTCYHEAHVSLSLSLFSLFACRRSVGSGMMS
ncbi:hypothetical protein CROQUDRAFT_429354 [Cronartium quercuum f. sp. fusiforme G11]|uniref:Uncharacterized protein n=1 Tax=Cronartium quercuum f. sp. fusiforme G11 TaxID=708437 RepID=A0A9P6NQ04_9BASI|nr:hypothetical protein CROQUDRAFT_429354 [Cronartium quercuum f. sp. fusiforme G11]